MVKKAEDVPVVHADNKEREKQWLEQEIEIEFYNSEEPGMMLKFPYGTTKNKKNYILFHGGRYKLPRKIVNHIQSRQTPIWNWKPNGLGQMEKSLSGYKPRFQCREVFV